MATTKTIELRTEIPGPRSREILERKERVIAAPLSIYRELVVAEGRGATITDVDGNLIIMAEQVRRAIAWVHKNAASFGGDPFSAAS